MTRDGKTSTYEPPALRVLGSVHGLTQGTAFGNASDGLGVHFVVNSSASVSVSV